jgi:hypothetical protein
MTVMALGWAASGNLPRTGLLRVYQIFFSEDQTAGLDYLPYRNDACTVYFENSVIKGLIDSGAHAGSDYFGVVSHQLRAKLHTARDAWRNNGSIANVSTEPFTPEAFERALERHAPDVLSFGRHPPHDPVSLADQYHPNFSRYFGQIMRAIGHEWTPVAFNDVFYFNYFVAKTPIYRRYVEEMLTPAMAVMDQMPELMQDSRYPHPLPEALRTRFGIPFYPYHPFLCERFFSYFAHLNQLRCAHF